MFKPLILAATTAAIITAAHAYDRDACTTTLSQATRTVEAGLASRQITSITAHMFLADDFNHYLRGETHSTIDWSPCADDPVMIVSMTLSSAERAALDEFYYQLGVASERAARRH
jgi:hypothetical protein